MTIKYSELKNANKYNTTIVFYTYVNYLNEYNKGKSETDKSKMLGNILTLFESKKDLIQEETPSEITPLEKMEFSDGDILDLSKCNPTFISCTLFFVDKDMTSIVLYLLRLLFFKYDIYKEKPRVRSNRRRFYNDQEENAMALNDYKELETLYERYVNKNDNFENMMFVTLYLSIY